MQAWLNEHYPLIVLVASLSFILWLANRLLLTDKHLGAEKKLPRQVLLLCLTIIALVILIVYSPMSEASRGQLLSLVGIVLTGVLAISSTTFVANALGGFMLRVVGGFQPGDFIRAGEHFGRVTERGLFHTEIQTEDRDLSTIPNLFLITNPVTVVDSSGTMISSGLSLGYDIPHNQVEKLLCEAAELAGLQDPFVFVHHLGDYSVEYKVYGFLTEVRQLLSAKSGLRKNMLDVLHKNRVEIVSPSFMNQRQLAAGVEFIPQAQRAAVKKDDNASRPEDMIFDKAEKASEIEELRKEITTLKDGEFSEENKTKIRESTARIDDLSKEIKDRTEDA
jgi:small-conductance mechanosensitive channel